MPLAVLFAGPNGSGKSTIVAQYRRESWFPHHYLNADEIAKTKTEGTQEDRERAAFSEARAMRQHYRESGESFAFETVFSHPSTLLDMRRLRAAGFTIHLVFVTTHSPEINVARVQRRYRAGGHDVPHEKIRSRYTWSRKRIASMSSITLRANRCFATNAQKRVRGSAPACQSTSAPR